MIAPARLLAALWMLLLLAGVATAQTGAAPHIAPSLVAETTSPRAGGEVTLAFAMKPAPGWHGYWKNPGDSGTETRAAWTLPAGMTAGQLAYPVPERLLIAGLMNYVYARDYAQLVTLRVPAGLAPGTALPVRAKLDWLACTEEICVPERAELALTLRIGDGTVAPDVRARFDGWRAALPRPLGSEGRFARTGDRFRLAVPLPSTMAVGEAYFYPLTDGAIDYAAPQAATRRGDMLVIETRDAARTAPPARVEGVLAIGGGRGLQLTAVAGDVPAAGVPPAAASGGAGDGDSGSGSGTLALTLAALGGAILGGLLLNVMPCVFPILSLKALSLARAGGEERAVRREALAYAAGVVLVCVALGGLLLVLRAGGSAAGWAFQLQSPGVILFLLLLVSAIGLNLAGLFELANLGIGGRLAGASGLAGAFWTGALAAFVATPCTGPFMGVALGAALVLPPAAALAVFAGLGLGIALPFLLLGFVPALRARLPGPGPWMERFRRILAVPMLLTALGLAWVLGRQAGVDGMTLGLAAVLLLALGLWWTGARQAAGRRAAWAPALPAALLALAAIPVVPRAASAGAAAPDGALRAEAFSEQRLTALRADGRPVFVYFTADWCLSCKVNEKAAIERAEVADAFRRAGVAVLVGDWTNGDAAIGRFLSRHGRSGVPLYLFYRGAGAPEVLPQILTPGRLTALAA